MPRSARYAALAVSALLGNGLATAAPAHAIEATTVVAQWHLDEAPGSTTMVDSIGDHDGTISSDVVVGVPGDPAVPGLAYEFTGPNPIVRVPHAADLNPGTAPLLIEAHLKVPATLGNGDYNVLQKGTATATGGAYKLEIMGKTANRKFGFPDCAFNSPGVKQRVFGPKRINDGQWHTVQCHLTDTEAFVTVDGVRGKVLKRTVGSIANTIGLTLGGKPNNTNYFNGAADEVSISIG